uniref:Uncharacterized protein n=1 Tax=Myoviridae sp. ctLnO19 TaxID=2825085 RepID=A0A8S5NZN3_9CAUD|nr:MAG TPA: hypothetical protein [Myoviridae sp. ctLnO19]
MHVQAIGSFSIPRLAKTREVQDFRYTPSYYYYDEKYKSPIANPDSDLFYIRGNQDVDYLYALHYQHPHWFQGSSEEAFANRESVINLTLNLLGRNYLDLIRQYLIRSGKYANKYVFDLFSDTVREVLYQVGEVNVPNRYSSIYHLGLIKDYFSNRALTGNIKNPEMTNTPVVGMKDLDKLFDTEGCTLQLIKACLKVGGIGKLIDVLYILYGSVLINQYIHHERQSS